MTRKNMIGSQVSPKSWMNFPKSKASGGIPCPIGISPQVLKRGRDPVARRELDAALAPRRGARRDARLVEPTRGVLGEDHAPPAREQAPDRGVVADVRGDAEEDHLVR